jgi:AraC-like DNA-binding protein
MTVKKYLDAATPPPTFVSLTKIALMSSTSLKTKFKKMYGTTVFEYFQSVRMQRARILLLTHKYSVKQIGHELGYSNLSNFTIAFKKEFNQLPHKLIR